MALFTFGQSQLPELVRIIPLSALILEWSDDTYRFDLVEQDSSLSVSTIGEATDRGAPRATAVIMNATAVVMHNAYEDPNLRAALRRMARESDSLVNITFEAKAISGQTSGATMDVSPMQTEIDVSDIQIEPWTAEWITTERPRLSIPITVTMSIDALDDYTDEFDGTFSKLFHHIAGFE